MKKMIMLGVYGLLILGVSAGGTLALRSSQQAAATAKPEKQEPLTPSAESLPVPADMTQPLAPPQEQELPVVVRPGEMSVEEIVRYGLGLKSREAAVLQREDSLQKTESRHRLVLADIDGEQKEIEGLVAQARDQRTASEQLLAAAQKERLESQKLLKEMDEKNRQSDIDRQRSKEQPSGSNGVDNLQVDRAANVKQLSGIVAGLSPEVASKMMRDFANDGKMETAVEILSSLEERKASTILDAMGDADDKLVKEFTDRFLELKQPTKVAKKR